MRPAWLDLLSRGRAFHSVRHALDWVAEHTGLPVVVVAAVALVLSWRLAKKTMHLVIEVAVALALLLLATRFGWVRW